MPAIPAALSRSQPPTSAPNGLPRASAFSPAPFQCEFAVFPQFNPHPAHSSHSTYPAHKILSLPIPLIPSPIQKIFKKFFISRVTFSYFCD